MGGDGGNFVQTYWHEELADEEYGYGTVPGFWRPFFHSIFSSSSKDERKTSACAQSIATSHYCMRVYTVQKKTPSVVPRWAYISSEKGPPLAGTCVYFYTTAYSKGVSRDLERCSHRMQPRVGTVFAQQQSTIRIFNIQYSSLTLALSKCGGRCLLLYMSSMRWEPVFSLGHFHTVDEQKGRVPCPPYLPYLPSFSQPRAGCVPSNGGGTKSTAVVYFARGARGGAILA